ncbi:hypothetical protein C8R43DRAFT_988090 [Mycena crocata]|nr:hypothetical protein C8R43DRAFT_988090 [Mycena crocata]
MRHELFDKALNMHKVGICHHDLEPRNILVDDDKHVHIVDFHVSSYNHVCRDPCDELVTLAKKIGLDNSESKMDENS